MSEQEVNLREFKFDAGVVTHGKRQRHREITRITY